MAQLAVYMDDETLERIGKAAASEGSSVSKWVRMRLVESLDSNWPKGYFEALKSLPKLDLKRPEQLDEALDVQRELL